MGKHIEVVLLEDVDNLGRSGDSCRVKAGYARNFLIPGKKATVATPGTKRLIEKKKAEALARLAKEKEDAEKQLKALQKITLTCKVKANADGRLFGSIGAAELVARLAEEGFALTKHQIALPEPFKALGKHDVPLHLHPEVQGVLKIKIVADTVEDAEADAE